MALAEPRIEDAREERGGEDGAAALEEEAQRVDGWLAALGPGLAGEWERGSPTAVRVLARLRRLSERREAEARLLIEDRRARRAEYRALADAEERALTAAGVTPTVAASELAEAGAGLALADARHAAFLAAMAALRQEEAAARAEAARAASLREEASRQARDAAEGLAAARRAAAAAREDREAGAPGREARELERPYLREKRRQYAESVVALKARIKASGVTASATHGSLVEAAASVERTRAELRPLRARVDAYQSLPPDETLAAVELERARRELAELDARLADEIRGMQMAAAQPP